MTREDYIKDGYSIDTSVYPNIAYKGARFKPEDVRIVLTVREEIWSDLVQEFIDTPITGTDADLNKMVQLKIKAKKKLDITIHNRTYL